MATGMAMRKNPYLDVEMILSLFFSSNYDNRPQQSVERVESVVGDVPERLVSIVGRKLFDDNLLGSQMVFGLDGNDIESFFQIVE